MSQMKAVRIHAYGGPEVLTYEDAPRPTPGEGQVLIRVQATSVNSWDGIVRKGIAANFLPLVLPVTPGTDIAGVIEEVGSGVTGFQPGDRVYGLGNPVVNGAYAEYAVIAAADTAIVPQSVDARTAAAVPNIGLAAWDGLVVQAKVTEGQTVLVHAAAGQVGHMAVEVAKMRGARVIGTASKNSEFLQELGVDQVIDYTAAPFEEVVENVDVVFDAVGGDTYVRSAKVLKPGGVLASTVQFMHGGPLEELATYDIQQAMVTKNVPKGQVLAELAPLLDSGKIKPHVTEVLPLADAAKAHEMIEGGHGRGKIVLHVAD